MPSYRFSFRDRYGDCREEVGRLALSDADETLTFGEAIIQDLQGGHAMPYAGWTMYITESARLHWKAIFPAGANVGSPTYIFQ
jgi:hypothetical protein